MFDLTHSDFPGTGTRALPAAALALLLLALGALAPPGAGAATPSPGSPGASAAATSTPSPSASAAAPAPASAPARAPAGAVGGASPPGAASAGSQTVDQQVQALKSDVLGLNRDLFILEQELLYPANTQVAVFVSIDAGTFFALDSVQLRLDGKDVANYLYTPREVSALEQGGVQRLYIGNVKVGKHELVAFFTGKGPHEMNYTRGAKLEFSKSISAKYLELRITDDPRTLGPEFAIKDWE
jgi:hypothetical protein